MKEKKKQYRIYPPFFYRKNGTLKKIEKIERTGFWVSCGLMILEFPVYGVLKATSNLTDEIFVNLYIFSCLLLLMAITFLDEVIGRKYYFDEDRVVIHNVINKVCASVRYQEIQCILICRQAVPCRDARYPDWADYTERIYDNGKWKSRKMAGMVVCQSHLILNWVQEEMRSDEIGWYWHKGSSFSADYGGCYGAVVKEESQLIGMYQQEPFEELLLQTQATVYILRDCYESYQNELDEVIEKMQAEKRVYIVVGKEKVSFYQYGNYKSLRARENT